MKAIMILLAALLAGCGGGDDPEPDVALRPACVDNPRACL